MKLKSRLFLLIVVIGVNQSVVADLGDMNGGDGLDSQAAEIRGYVQLATSIISHGYSFFTKNKTDYDLQEDVLNVPYKKMI